MIAAGGKLPSQGLTGAINDIFNMGAQYNQVQTREQRNPLGTQDINGDKRNRYG